MRHNYSVALTHPQYYIAELRSLQGEMILSLTYGYDAKGPEDPKIVVVKKMAQLAATTTLPGALLVNNLPSRAFSHHLSHRHCTMMVHLSATHPRMDALVQL